MKCLKTGGRILFLDTALLFPFDMFSSPATDAIAFNMAGSGTYINLDEIDTQVDVVVESTDDGFLIPSKNVFVTTPAHFKISDDLMDFLQKWNDGTASELINNVNVFTEI